MTTTTSHYRAPVSAENVASPAMCPKRSPGLEERPAAITNMLRRVCLAVVPLASDDAAIRRSAAARLVGWACSHESGDILHMIALESSRPHLEGRGL